MPSIHFDIPIQKVLLRRQYLFNMDGAGYVEAEIIAGSSYPGHALTFTALIEGKYLFHYLPVNSFVAKETRNKLPLETACYFNCPSTEVAVSKLPTLDKCKVYDKSKSVIDNGKYIMTFDWYEDNELAHLILLDDGQYMLAPSHKVVFGEGTLPDYKKLRATWKI